MEEFKEILHMRSIKIEVSGTKKESQERLKRVLGT